MFQIFYQSLASDGRETAQGVSIRPIQGDTDYTTTARSSFNTATLPLHSEAEVFPMGKYFEVIPHCGVIRAWGIDGGARFGFPYTCAANAETRCPPPSPVFPGLRFVICRIGAALRTSWRDAQ